MGGTLPEFIPLVNVNKNHSQFFGRHKMEKGSVYIDSSYGLHYPEGATHMDGFPEELRSVVHDHWGNFPPQHPLIPDLFGVIFFFLWIVSFLGNGCVIYVFLATPKLRTPTNIFIVNLAFSDLCMMTTQGFPVVINAFASDFWMWGATLCRVYACIGGIFGVASIMTMVVIGYDRYNVIVKGFKGTKITFGKAAIILILVWLYAALGCCPPFLGWGGYALEGLFLTCSYDFLTEDWNHKSYCLYAFLANFILPLTLVVFFYSQIFKAVVVHEAALKAQAKKMNVDSLRSNADDGGDSAEVKIAKVAITNVMLWVGIWSPYAIVCMISCFGDRTLVTPLVSQLPAFFAKIASCLNPVVFAVSHPKYREALAIKCACMGIGDKPNDDNQTKMQTMKE